MSADASSLARLHDIVVPDPTPWWPPAPGWLWLASMALVLLVAALLAAFIRRQKNGYRREALAALVRLESTAATPSADAILPALAELLKRTALTAYPREDVAALTGPRWFAFLDRTGGTRFSAGLGAAMERATYLPRNPEQDNARTLELLHEVRTWIQRHRSPAETSGSDGDIGASQPLASAADAAIK